MIGLTLQHTNDERYLVLDKVIGKDVSMSIEKNYYVVEQETSHKIMMIEISNAELKEYKIIDLSSLSEGLSLFNALRNVG